MHLNAPPALTPDDIDDVLYFTRVNSADELNQTVVHLVQRFQSTPDAVLAACVDPSSGNTVLHYCAANGLEDILKTSLGLLGLQSQPSVSDTYRPLVNHQNHQGNTPLHWAAYNGHLPAVKLLVAAGADMWIKNAAGHLAMFEAERADKSDVVQFLLEAGGKEVERTGVERQPSAEDEVEVQAGEASSSNGAVH